MTHASGIDAASEKVMPFGTFMMWSLFTLANLEGKIWIRATVELRVRCKKIMGI